MILWFFNETNCAQSRLLFTGKKLGKEGVIKKCKIESLLAKSGENDRFRGQIPRPNSAAKLAVKSRKRSAVSLWKMIFSYNFV